jgi:hypothetical protein
MKSLFLTIIVGLASAGWILDGDNEISKTIKEEASKLAETDDVEKLSTMSKWI